MERSFSLSTILLKLIYHVLGHYVVKEPYPVVSGALWFVQHWLFVWFPKITGRHTLTPKIVPPLRTKSQDELMTIFIILMDYPLRLIYLRPIHVDHIIWDQALLSAQPYVQDFESLLTFVYTTCKVLASGGCFPSTLASTTSPLGLIPYMPYLRAFQFCFT